MTLRLVGGVVPTLVALFLASPGSALASCVPPAFQTFAGAADTVVLEGEIVAVEPARVIADATKWWGTGPLQRVAIQRPVADPTVITSVDWAPQAGESWIIIARRQDDLLVTGTCEQLPADPATLGEVQSSLGDPVVPQPAAEPSPPTGQVASQGVPVLPLAIAGLSVLVLGGVLMWQRRGRIAP